jgi:PPOX class probable F420-dependent enzyme
VAKLGEKEQRFLEQPYYGVVTTLRKDGSPHNTVVWVDVEDGIPTFNTAEGRAKARHLGRNPRAAMTVVDPNDGYRWLAVEGPAEVTTDDADAQIDRLAKKYDGADGYQGRTPGMVRVKVRIQPEHLTTRGFD